MKNFFKENKSKKSILESWTGIPNEEQPMYRQQIKEKQKPEDKKDEEEIIKKKINKLSLIGLILSLASIPFYFIGIIPILAVIFSAIGLYQLRKRKNQEKGLYFAIVGLIVGIIYTLMYMGAYGHLSFLTNNNEMVRMDGCVSACPSSSGLAGFLPSSPSSQCKAKCVEKYGITIEDYNNWKEKQK